MNPIREAALAARLANKPKTIKARTWTCPMPKGQTWAERKVEILRRKDSLELERLEKLHLLDKLHKFCKMPTAQWVDLNKTIEATLK